MLNMSDIMETITMIQDENLDIRTITMGISLIDCCDSDIDRSCEKVYSKIHRYAKTWSRPGKTLKNNMAFPSLTNGYPSPPSPFWREYPEVIRSNTPKPWTGWPKT